MAGSRSRRWRRTPASLRRRAREFQRFKARSSKALALVLRHPVTVVGSSRTDAGVHAKGQIAHFDTTLPQIPTDGLRRAVNAQLPGDILIRRIEPVPDSFDAIQSTIRKRYQYFIWNRPDRPVFFNDLAWHRWHKLDARRWPRPRASRGRA